MRRRYNYCFNRLRQLRLECQSQDLNGKGGLGWEGVVLFEHAARYMAMAMHEARAELAVALPCRSTRGDGRGAAVVGPSASLSRCSSPPTATTTITHTVAAH